MNKSQHYNMNKPTLLDIVDVENINDNTDIVDLELRKVNDKVDVLEGNLQDELNDEKIKLVNNITKTDEIEQDLTAHKEEFTQQRQQDQLKVAKVEKDINDYQSTMSQVNVNQEAKQNVSGYGTISLPKNSANGKVDVGLKGDTRTSLFSRRDEFKFEYGIGNIPNSNISVTEGKTYTISAFIVNGSTNLARIRTAPYYATYATNDILSGSSGWAMCTFVALTTEILTLDVQILGGEMANNNCVVTMLMVEETNNRKSFITGTKSTISASRLKSVGKNLLPHKEGVQSFKDWAPQFSGKFKIEGEYFNQVGSGSVYSKSFYLEKGDYNIQLFGQVVEGTSYSFNLVDINNQIVGTIRYVMPSLATYSQAINVEDKGTYRLRILSGSASVTAKFKDVSIEKGTVTTPYEPYTESTQYLPNVGELRSLPNGVKDEIRVSGGKAEKVQRNNKYVLQTSDISFWESRNNVEVVWFKKQPDDINYNNATIRYGSATIGDYRATQNIGDVIDDVSSHYKLFMSGSITAYILVVPKGTYINLADAQTKLTGLELTYQLAEPIITPINVSGTLLSNPSGTVYVENVVADAGVYTTKFDIKELQLPIKSIDKLIKYNFEDGVQTVLDTSLAVINEDKLSFTHPNLTKDDMVFVDYYYDVESTLGETTIEYLDSRHTIKDSVNNKFYSWDIKSTNGVPTVELTEVL